MLRQDFAFFAACGAFAAFVALAAFGFADFTARLRLAVAGAECSVPGASCSVPADWCSVPGASA